MNEGELELQMAGYQKVYDYTQYSHDNNVNVIPEEAFKRLIRDTFKTITDVLRATYGPYGSSVVISDQSQTITTKDGYNVYESMGFNHAYKRMVYLAIQDIIKRVNRNVGDGTTSCILLAEKIFNNLNEIIDTPDDKRLILEILSDIEKDLQNTDRINEDRHTHIQNLTKYSLRNLIRMAANYDEELTDVIYEALDPVMNETGDVVSVRNVVADEDVSLDADSNAVYSFSYLPGDYRVRINISTDDALALANVTKLRCVIYDHAFNAADWKNFTKSWDNVPTIILARTFTHSFMQQEWMDYQKQIRFAKKLGQGDGEANLYLAEVKGDFVQHEIQDLAQIIKTDVRGVHAMEVDHTELPTVDVQVVKGNCLTFHNVKGNNNDAYIAKLTAEMNNDDSHSYVKEKEYRARIKAIKMDSKDATLTVKCGTNLEAKLIMDKIDDCIAIVNSAINSGIVPNLLNYAYYRVSVYYSDDTLLENKVAKAIKKAIAGLFMDVWKSKYGDSCDETGETTMKNFYAQSNDSYDIVAGDTCTMDAYPTSAQYDLEVVVASLSIVKYLLTGRALIFDAHLLPQVNDGGHYAQQY